MSVVAPSFSDLLTLGLAEAQARRPDLAFLGGDITTAQLHGASAMSDKVFELAAKFFRDTFFDGAEGDALTALVDDHCNIQRVAATNAQVFVWVTRTSGGAGGTIPAGTRFGATASPTGSQVIFTLDANLVVPAASNGPFYVACTAAVTGPEGNVAIGTITKILDPLFDSTFSVVNSDLAGAGGNLQESDVALRQRVKLFFVTLRRGTLAALEYGARQISTVQISHAYENPSTFQVTVIVSDSSGGSSLQMVSDVTAEIENWRCAGVPVTVAGGIQSLIDITVQLVAVSAGFDTATAASSIQAVVAAKINARRGGETVYLDMLVAAVIAVAPDDIFDVAFPTILVGGIGQQPQDIVPASLAITLRSNSVTVIGPS